MDPEYVANQVMEEVNYEIKGMALEDALETVELITENLRVTADALKEDIRRAEEEDDDA